MKKIFVLMFVLASVGTALGQAAPAPELTIGQCRNFADSILSVGSSSQEDFTHMFDQVTIGQLIAAQKKVNRCTLLDGPRTSTYYSVGFNLGLEVQTRFMKFLADQELLDTFRALDEKTHKPTR